MTLRDDLAALRAVRARMTPGPWRGSSPARRDDRAGLIATHNAADRLLDALERIAAVVNGYDGRTDYALEVVDEIRAILDGAREGGG